MKAEKTAYTDSLDYKGESDYGYIFEFQCPKCRCYLTVSQLADHKAKCYCNLVWRLVLYAEGDEE